MSVIVAPNQFDFEYIKNLKVQSRKAGNQGTKKKIKYMDIITAFDIETTRIIVIEQSFMYVWQWQFGHDYTVIGRTWDEFNNFQQQIAALLKEDEYICTFVHNLSYEFQFLRGIYNFQKEDVFALDSRKVLKCTMYNHFELRCSYIHSNMGLDEYTHKMGAEHGKLSGEDFDYSIMRFPWTVLKPKELEYAVNDVLGLVEAIEIEMKLDNDNLYTFPLTSTGYVRRDSKAAMRLVSHTFVRNQLPNYYTYQMLREAFRGGNTHANRYYAGIVLKNVKSSDRSSSYPDVLCNCQFPVSDFYHAGGVSFNELLDLINVRKKAVIMRVSITKVRLHDKFWGAPYLSRDKCRNMSGAIFDNGRILEADYLETTITDIDFKIILSEYDFDDFVPFDVEHARYGVLPKPLIETTIEYYVAKTELKNVAGEELYYMKSKNKLNSIYGMMAQDPVKQSIDFINDEFVKHCDNPEEILTTNNKKAFLCYQWGVWVTAWARYRLEEGIQIAGDSFVYCDTDSVKYIDNGEVKDCDWETFNKQRIKDSKKSGAFATDPKGITHYMGVFEEEPEYAEFSTLGAKKYCYKEKGDNTIHVTIAGVTKKKGGEELEKAGGMEAFKEGFIFGREGGKKDGEILVQGAGGTEAVYNDKPPMTHYEIDGHTIPITSNVVLRDSTYTLGITAEYERLLEISQKGIDI
jgi:hypothetical protein